MFLEQSFYVGIRDINSNYELKNTSLLAYLEDIGGIHSEYAGYGILDIPKTKRSWILLSWKIEVLKRPKYNDTINVKTWSKKTDRYNSPRDFLVYDSDNNTIVKGTSNWFFIDLEKNKPIKIPDEVSECYKIEKDNAFENEAIEKLHEPDNYISCINYKVTKNMIDFNNHLHNIYYMDIATEALPKEINYEFNTFEIMYKKEIKLGSTVKAYYSKVDDWHYVTIKSEDEAIIHSIIRLK